MTFLTKREFLLCMSFIELYDVLYAPDWGILKVSEVIIDDIPVLSAFQLSTRQVLQLKSNTSTNLAKYRSQGCFLLRPSLPKTQEALK